MKKSRIAVIGAGHNALVCACYLAKAGHDVTAYESRSRVGGAVNTEELWPGYRVDTCSVMHILIHKTPVIEELGLHRFGLDYMQMDPWGFAPFPDGSHILFYKDLDRTCQSIAAVSERDAERYRAFVSKWHKFNEQVFEVFSRSPAPGAMVGGIARRTAIAQMRGEHDPSMTGAELLRVVLGSYDKMLAETFESEQVRAAVGWMAAQSGPPPSEVGAGALAGAHSLYHDVGATRPRGGSGMLSQALARCLEHHGGTVRCGTPVKRVLLGSRGGVRGVELHGGERVAADLVVSGAHVQTTLLEMVGREHLPGSMRGKVESLRVGNGIGMTLRCAIDELPAYTSYAPSQQGSADCHHAMQLICPSVEYLQAAYDDAKRGHPARRPALVAMTPSSVDPSIAPPGKHALYIWAQYHPYALAGGEHWDDIREREANRLLRTLAEYAPNVPADVRDVAHHYIQTPLDLERNVGLLKGNIMHIDMSLDQMFMFRPLPELAYYRTPIQGLYLTGASTHPGGGVSGASGRNAAHAVLSDLAGKRRSWRGAAVAGAGLIAAGMLAGRC
ncbi:MAG TPA: NAD(P)/FAD-dependent oxidoreductase, partial [Chloroflexia bacterium]|nr:NAD(P)/FAD-dependent oxidoreductase [Chloroflexia bacterium]